MEKFKAFLSDSCNKWTQEVIAKDENAAIELIEKEILDKEIYLYNIKYVCQVSL